MTEDPMTPDAGAPASGSGTLLRLDAVAKRYGRTQALDGATLDVRPAEVLGIVGHNGAGKSTLMRVIVGVTAPDSGRIELDGREVPRWTAEVARSAGVRIVFQELSLCPDLRVFENVLVSNPGLGGRGWRSRARRLIRAQLDEVFPGHGISPWARIEALSLAQRQMVEIAQATLRVREPRLVILDEPTSALDQDAAANLFRFFERERTRGVSFIFISHRMPEVLGHTNRITVMRDGQVVATRPTAAVGEDDLVELMGGVVEQRDTAARRSSAAAGKPAIAVRDLSTHRLHSVDVSAARGEVVGLAGLEGQGQQELLLELWRRRNRRVTGGGVRTAGRMAFVTGNRQDGGVFPLWPLASNISIGALGRVVRRGAVSSREERRLAAHWIERLAVRGGPRSDIVDLSGGNQQKVLIARALAAGADVILLDDPFRGVDITTRQDTYRLIRDEAAEHGRAFLWFSTENRELEQCDRVYVFSEGAVVAELGGDEITEDRIIAASFSRRAGQDGAASPRSQEPRPA